MSACSAVGFVLGLAVSAAVVGHVFYLFGIAGAIVGFLVGIGVTCWLTARATRSHRDDENPDGTTP